MPLNAPPPIAYANIPASTGTTGGHYGYMHQEQEHMLWTVQCSGDGCDCNHFVDTGV